MKKKNHNIPVFPSKKQYSHFIKPSRMEKVCSGLNQLITAADSSPSFRSMVLVTLTHIFLELDMLHAHPPAFEAFVEILLEQASPPQPPTPSRSSSASLAPTAEHTLPPGARLLRLHATECLREIELAYPTIFAAQLPHFLAFARRDLTHASYSFSLLAAQVLHHAVFAQHSHEAAQTSPLFAEHEVDLLPISFPIDFAPPAPHQASSLVPRSALPPQHEITEALIKRAWVAVAGEAMNGQTKWGSCELLLLLYSIRSALGVDRDLDKTISPFVSTFARTASPLHVHLLLKLFRASVAAGQSPLATSDDINALSTTIASAISCVEALTPRLLLAHLIPAANSFSSSPALPLAAWPSVFDPLPLKLARLSSFVASLPASDPTRYAPQLLSVLQVSYFFFFVYIITICLFVSLQCLESEAKASAHLPTPGDATRAYFGVLEQYIARFPSASTSLFSLFASWLELETGNAPPPSSLGLIGALLDRLKETQASLSLLQLLAEALLRLHEKNATALIHYVPIAQRVLEEPQIPPAVCELFAFFLFVCFKVTHFFSSQTKASSPSLYSMCIILHSFRSIICLLLHISSCSLHSFSYCRCSSSGRRFSSSSSSSLVIFIFTISMVNRKLDHRSLSHGSIDSYRLFSLPSARHTSLAPRLLLSRLGNSQSGRLFLPSRYSRSFTHEAPPTPPTCCS